MNVKTETEAAIAAIWLRQIPQTRERLALLSRAADELAHTQSIAPELRTEAISIAHKLAGSLGMFGFDGSSEHARLIQQELEHPGQPSSDGLLLHVNNLRKSLKRPLSAA